MYHLNSPQQPSASLYLEAYMPMESQDIRSEKQPGHRGPLCQQARKICHWQPYSFQTQFLHSHGHNRSLNACLGTSTYDEGSLPIQDSNKMIRIYEKAFEKLQQTNCRILAKAYIRLLEPRKQVDHPYNGRKSVGGVTLQLDPEDSKPSWWPSRVRHREPDHLLKAERIRLLIHIVRELRVSHGISVETLKMADRAIRDQIRPKSRIRFLEEVYNTRAAEEQLLCLQTDKQPVKQPSYPDVFDEAKRASGDSGSPGCSDNDPNSIQFMDAFASDVWAYCPVSNASLPAFTYCGPVQHISSRQGENCQDHGQLLTDFCQPVIPSNIQHSQWEPGRIETSSFTGNFHYKSQIPYWYIGANALTQEERYKTTYYVSASGSQ